MEKLINEYLERFDENFPIFMMMGIEDEKIKEIIKKCLEENKPFVIERESEDAIY